MAPLINVAVIGYGMSAKTFHLPLILSLPDKFNLHTILQRSAATCLDDFPNVKHVRDIQGVVDDPEVELVVITTSNDTHFPFAKKALESGKNVIVEKPLTPDVKSAEELNRLANEKGRILSVYQNRRWDGDFLTAKSLIESGKLGRLVRFESHFDRFRPQLRGGWRDTDENGGGVLLDLGSHLVDQAVTLFGPPSSVTAFVSNQRKIGLPSISDEFHITLEYPDGLRCLLAATCLSPLVAQPRYMILGDKASYVKNYVDVQEDQLKSGQSPRSHPQTFGIESDPALHGTLTTISPTNTSPQAPELVAAKYPTLPGRYIDYYVNIAEAVGKKDPRALAVKVEHVIQTTKVLELAARSAKEHKTLQFDA